MATAGRFNEPPKVLNGPSLLHEMIDWETFSQRCALDFTANGKRQSYTYQEFRDCINVLVSAIQNFLGNEINSAEPSRRHIVPIFMPQSPGQYISQLAVLQSGGVFCPINLDAPKDRIAYVVDDIEAKFILTTSRLKDKLPESCPDLILVDEFPVVAEQQLAQSHSLWTASAHDLAYVMYTSGSTGKPKGVEISHFAVTQSLLAHERHLPTFKRFLQFASPSFDVSIFEIYFPLMRGCTVVGCERTELLNNLPRVIKELDVDAAELTPTIVNSFIQTREHVPGLKLLVTIGEMLTRRIITEFGGSEDRSSILYGMYGPTEATIHCTICSSMRADAEPGNIGMPFDTVSAFVTAMKREDLFHHESPAHLNLLPHGEIGELVLGGHQLANGYLKRDAENAASFVTFEGQRYYRTGDKARLLNDGSIEFLGRIESGQVKLRGQRVELGEVEDAVYRHSSVKTVYAAIIAGVLVAFALTRDKAVIASDILETCAGWLPEYMVPSEVVLLDEFPYAPSGKIDKLKLEFDYERAQDTGMDKDAPSSSIEHSVRDALVEVLGQLSTTRLAAAGLDSLSAIRVASKLKASGYDVESLTVLRCESLSTLVELCGRAGDVGSAAKHESTTDLVRLTSAPFNGNSKDVEMILPCTPVQNAMLAETAINPEAYRNWVELELTDTTDMDAVEWALREWIEHTPMLRTGFMDSRDGHGYSQIIWRDILDSQIGEVETFKYDFDEDLDDSLLRPLRCQLLQMHTIIRILIHMHHALYDAWSIELLLDDLDARLTDHLAENSIICNGLADSAMSSCHEKYQSLASRPSFKFVVDGYVNGTILSDPLASQGYWKDHLSNLNISTLSNFHHAKPSPPGLAVIHHTTMIATADVEAAAKRLLVSPQSLFQAAYALLLGSYLGDPDLCFGVIFSGRTLPIPGIEHIIGPCFSTLPIRVDLSTSTTVHDIVRELNRTTRKHLEYSTVPLQDIKGIATIPPRQQLFDTLFIWQQTLHGYDHTRKHVSLVDTIDQIEFNLTLEVIPGQGNICLKVNYQQALFPPSQIEAFVRQVEHLARLAMDPTTHTVSNAFNNLNQKLLSMDNSHPNESMPKVTLTSPIERMALYDPHRIAIEFATSIRPDGLDLERLTYNELNVRANQIGHYLLRLNCEANDQVCICMEKSIDLYSSILATAKIGVGYLPLTPKVPIGRLKSILHEAGVKIVITTTDLRSMFDSHPATIVVFVDDLALTRLPSIDQCSVSSSLDDLAYCTFTSGSTGKPKGVLVTQRNILSNLTALEELYPASRTTKLLQSCSQAFDVSVFEIFFVWRIGGCLCAGLKDDIFRDIEHAIRLFKVTHLSLTPTVAGLINPANVPEVRFLVTAGEALTTTVFYAWAGKGLHQGYGPSETTNICTLHSNVTELDNINHIGKVLRNTSAFVLSDHSEFAIAPRGGEGELVFGGSQVFQGYLDKTQEEGRTLQHPLYGRLYRSGDYGRMLSDGSLIYTRRKDDQIKIRGQRVELSEINTILQSFDEVKDCSTLVIQGVNGMEKLVSFWTNTASPPNISRCIQPDKVVIEKLYNELVAFLPSYMIPSALIPVTTLPITVLGKLDRECLKIMYRELDSSYLNRTARVCQSNTDYTWNDLELYIVQALVETLRVKAENVRPHTSFFTLGLDSISAISLARNLRENAQKHVEISDVLRDNTVTRLAEVLASRDLGMADQGNASDSLQFGFSMSFIDSVKESFDQVGKTVQSVMPCTALQDAMLSASQIISKKAYVNHVIFEIHGNFELLRDCWMEMIRRHQILRTCFINTVMPRHANVQVILESYEPAWVELDMEIDESSLIIAKLEGQCTFADFEPPYTFRVVSTPLKGRKLALSIHHALYDGVAMAILYEEVEKAYHRRTLPPAISFAPYLRRIMSLNLDNADKFWDEELKGYTSKSSQIQRSYLALENSPTAVHTYSATFALTWIEEQVRSLDTSLLAVCHAVWAAIISEQQHISDVCFGNVVSGRHMLLDGIDRLVAPCFNTIPIRLQHTHQLSYLEAVRRLQHIHTATLPFHLTPLRRIQSKFRSHSWRLFDTLFILQHPGRTLDPSIWSISEDRGVMDFPLVFEVIPKHSVDTLDFILHSDSSVSAGDAKSIISLFDFKLKEGLENPRRPILSASLKEQIMLRETTSAPFENFSSQDNYSKKEMTVTEIMIRDIISALSHKPVEMIGRSTSIFKLGIDSINSIQVATRLKSMGYNVRATDVLQHSTILRLGVHLERMSLGAGCQSSTFDFEGFDKMHRSAIMRIFDIDTTAVEAIRPCTPVQQGMIAQSMHSGNEEYWNSTYLELEPSLSLQEFREAWNIVASQHEMLRTGFVSIEDTRYSFAMVTFDTKHYTVAWHIGTAPNSKILLHPWCLKIISGANICVQFLAHHAIYDAQSIHMILSDVARHCKGKSSFARPPIAPLLQDILLATEDVSESKSFWKSEGDHIAVHKFPDLTPLYDIDPTTFFCERHSKLSLTTLEAQCMQYEVTTQIATQVAWARLLSAYVGEPRVTFGVTLSGRSIHPQASETSFPTIVTLPVTCDLTGNNLEVLTRNMHMSIQLQRHQFAPLRSIQEWVGSADSSLFDTLFLYQNPTEQVESDRPWKVSKEEARVEYAVSMEVQALPSGDITLRLSSTTDIIPEAHARLILDQYDNLLLDTLQNPQAPCNIAPDLRSELLSITPAKEIEIESHVSLLHQFVELGAKKWPHKVALEFTTSLEPVRLVRRGWTYTELDENSNRIAQMLIHHSVVPRQMIAICFEKCPEASFAIVGILKAGCAYVALDPNAPDDRLAYMIKDSAAQLVLTAGNLVERIKSAGDKLVIDLGSSALLDKYLCEAPELSSQITPQDLCYCLYTSGTTGLPKGCLISHESAVQVMLSFQRLFAGHWNEESKWLQFASFHFDPSTLEQFWSWSVGICVASAPRDLIFEDIPRAINRLGITHIDLTPSLARLLHPNDVPSLCKGVFITGGEQLKQDILDVWGDKMCIYNGYGPTETTTGVTMYPRVPKNGKLANIGPQFDNVGSFVLMPNSQNPVLRGGVGELAISGKLVGKGYLNRRELTAEKFPTLEKYGERVYRTGDLVRILHDGSFLFIGRADDQVKLRGQRLELGEINSVVKKSHIDVLDVVTLIMKHKKRGKEHLICFFVALSDSLDLLPTIKGACRARLPRYMIPTHFMPLGALPLNVNNKADTKQLANLYNEKSLDELHNSHAQSQVPKWSEAETSIVDTIARYLHIESSAIRPDTSIFEHGLDSISIIGFADAMTNAGFDKAKLSVVKNNPIISDLVKILLEKKCPSNGKEGAYLKAKQNIAAFAQKNSKSICKDLGIESMEVEAIAPATPVQQGMIYRFLESHRLLYLHAFKFRLQNHVDSQRLTSAWDRMVMKLQILRTKFVATDDGYAQVVIRSMERSGSRKAVDCATMEKRLALARPCSFSLHRHTDGDVLSLKIFHGLYDGSSLDLMLECLIREYRGENGVDYGPSFHRTLSFGPLAMMPGGEVFWKNHLKDWKYRPMPQPIESDRIVIARKTVVGLVGFESLRKKLGVLHQAMIQASWLSLLQTILSPNLTLGLVTSGRSIDFEGAQKVIGPLLNTVPLHIQLEPGSDMAALIRQCQKLNQEVENYQHTPLNEIQKWVSPKHGQALFENLFVFHRSDSQREQLIRDFWTQIEEEPRIDDYALALEATLNEESTQLGLLLTTRASIMTQSKANDLLQRLEDLVHTTLRDSGMNMVPFVSESDIHMPASLVATTSHLNCLDIALEQTFQWTTKTQWIRSNIAILANISEDSIEEHTSIFGVGLDSIDVIKLASRLRKGGIEIPVSTIIRCQSIASMLEYVQIIDLQKPMPTGIFQRITRQMLQSQGENQLPKEYETFLPATPLQQTMYNQMINSNFKQYFTIEAFEIREEVEVDKLMTAIQEVVARSPILRTTFIEVSEPEVAVSYAQVVLRDWHDIKKLNEANTKEEIMDSIRNEGDADKSIFKVRFASSSRHRYLVIAISHALYDGTSLLAFHQDIQEAYDGRLSPRPDPMPYLEQVFNSTTQEAKDFWRSALSNLPPAGLPPRYLSSDKASEERYKLQRPSRTSLQEVESLCKSSRVTMQTFSQTCWALVLAELMGQLDVVFGCVLSCRDSEEASQVMFPLMNTVAVRSVLHGSLKEMLRYMQDQSDATREFQHFPLGKAQAMALAMKKMQPADKDAVLFDTLFIFQGRRQPQKQNSLYESVQGSSDVEFPVCVEMEIVDNQLIWTTACKAPVRNSERAVEILDKLDVVLQRMIANPDSPTFDINPAGITICGLPRFHIADKSTAEHRDIRKSASDEAWSSTESSIREALHKLSGVPKNSIRKDSAIFHLGLDSISVLKLPALFRKVGIKLTVSEVMKHLTIRAMAQSLEVVALGHADGQVHSSLDVDTILARSICQAEVSEAFKALSIKAENISYIMPVTSGQLYTIRRWQESRGSLFFHSFKYSSPGDFDQFRFKEAWLRLLERHDIMRTAFVEVESKVLQIVYKAPHIIPTLYSELLNMNAKDLHLPPVCLRVENDEGTTEVVLRIHHALYDGISLPIMIQELQALYSGDRLDPVNLSFKQFVAESIFAVQTEFDVSDQSQTTQQLWTSYLQTNPSLLPIRAPAQPKRTEVFQSLMPILSLKSRAQAEGVSIDSLLLATVSKVYVNHLQSLDHHPPPLSIIIGIYLANRAPFGQDLSTLVAPTLNVVPLHVQDPSIKSILELATNIQKDLQSIVSKKMVFASLNEIYEWTGVRVNFCVNILKTRDQADSLSNKDDVLRQVGDTRKKAEEVEVEFDENVEVFESEMCDAYLPSVDMELRYNEYEGEGALDLGLFGPSNMLSVFEAKRMIENFLDYQNSLY